MEQLLVNRKIVISEPISDVLAGRVIEQIMDVNDYDDQMRASIEQYGGKYQPEPIEMFINSGGGSAHAGYAIIGAMELSETPVVTFGLGLVASMALGIFASGDVRVAHKMVRMMYHSVAYGEEGMIQDHIDNLKEVTIIQGMYSDIFKNTNLTKEMMDEISKKRENFFFSGEEAVKLGIADDVFTKEIVYNKKDTQSEKTEKNIIESIDYNKVFKKQ